MTRRLFFAGIAALTLISSGCCGAPYGCGGCGACSWYPGKVLGQAFACHGCGVGGYGGGWCGAGGGCGVGCDSCDGHGNWNGPVDGYIQPSPEAIPGPAYYPRAVRSAPRPPAPPKEASSRWGYRRQHVRPVNYTQQPGTPLVKQPGSCQDGRCQDGRCPCGRH